MTQLNQVKALLKNNPNGVCATKFLDYRIPRFGHHIWDLRTNHSWLIETLKCDLEGHNHKDKQYKYLWQRVSPTPFNNESSVNLRVVRDPIETPPMTREEKRKMINELLEAKGLNKIK